MLLSNPLTEVTSSDGGGAERLRQRHHSAYYKTLKHHDESEAVTLREQVASCCFVADTHGHLKSSDMYQTLSLKAG